MSESDDEPPQSFKIAVDTSEFFFPGEGLSALLVHGLGGTPFEMRYLGEQLAAAGIRVRGVRLAGHAGAPYELGATGPDNWYESVVHGFEELRQYGDPNVVIGQSLGAVLGARLAVDQRESVAGLVMLSAAFFLPPAVSAALKAASLLGPVVDKLYVHVADSSDIHDAAARQIHPTMHLTPLSAPIRLMALSAQVRPMLPRVTQPALVIHAKNDHTCPVARNVNYVMKNLGSTAKRAVHLEESYHVVSVDSERDRVVAEILGFVDQLRAQPHRAAV
ncbi:MAG TPA: alpha/beta fold hydrolase [Candidatus Binataceae bacterium]|nr:alpha/beta fold hydrolase [Candidatus Binataceae bacterium]